MRHLPSRIATVQTSLIRALLVACVAVAGAAASGQAVETMTLDAAAPMRPFPHYWERMFGSGRAVLSLRESYRDDLRAVRSVAGDAYVRFHGILNDEVGVYSEGAHGEAIYNFSYVDQIYDGLLADGVRPIVELSFMPPAWPRPIHEHTFWYQPVIAPPKDYGRWDAFITALARTWSSATGSMRSAAWKPLLPRPLCREKMSCSESSNRNAIS